jgi:hypothetical protein
MGSVDKSPMDKSSIVAYTFFGFGEDFDLEAKGFQSRIVFCPDESALLVIEIPTDFSGNVVDRFLEYFQSFSEVIKSCQDFCHLEINTDSIVIKGYPLFETEAEADSLEAVRSKAQKITDIVAKAFSNNIDNE